MAFQVTLEAVQEWLDDDMSLQTLKNQFTTQQVFDMLENKDQIKNDDQSEALMDVMCRGPGRDLRPARPAAAAPERMVEILEQVFPDSVPVHDLLFGSPLPWRARALPRRVQGMDARRAGLAARIRPGGHLPPTPLLRTQAMKRMRTRTRCPTGA